MQNGLLLVDKEPGMTSHDAVQKVRRVIRQKKVGHTGTLDPDATGLLVLTLGKATRLTRFFIQAPKVYEGTVRFGTSTDTYDASGDVTAERPIDGLTEDAVRAAMAELEGTYEQTPPPYCAKKINGVKYYELARRGEEVPLEPKEVTVYGFELQPAKPANAGEAGGLADGQITFRLSCSSGTYARTIAHELGEKLGTGGHLSSLRRLQVGRFAVTDAVTVGELQRRLDSGEPVEPAWIPFDAVPLPFAEVVADAQQERRLLHGQSVLLRDLAGEEGDWVKLLNRRNEFIAVGSVVERIGGGGVGLVQPKIVFT
ncbi:MAG TPA: tRNA pseudouridine(55) synthase TruB [Thermoanaerobaculia bacterium]|jgi:tRNA pseudouridine55 synthase|nr:tRNA pseudouridine(55) synthase TruB [Thermoanaerobaculia bacterium]